jgi:hypothetical protein
MGDFRLVIMHFPRLLPSFAYGLGCNWASGGASQGKAWAGKY